MSKIEKEINNATCVDELFAISGRYYEKFGLWSKEYDNVVGLCLNRFKQIYGISYHEYREKTDAKSSR
jgi:hypothetical protein